MKSKPSSYLEESNPKADKTKERAVQRQIIASDKQQAKLWAEDRVVQRQKKSTEKKKNAIMGRVKKSKSKSRSDWIASQT